MAFGVYRTKTYIAADWDGDKNAVDQLHKWNNSEYWGLHFVDVHEATQSSDSSLNCSIKRSLKGRMDISKMFILIVGDKTNSVRSGSCEYCDSYYNNRCYRGYTTDFRSYVRFECDKASEAFDNGEIKIVVLYNSTSVDKTKCPEAVRNVGKHIPMVYYENGKYYWDYSAVKNAIES